jgi:hypothetical protein
MACVEETLATSEGLQTNDLKFFGSSSSVHGAYR